MPSPITHTFHSLTPGVAHRVAPPSCQTHPYTLSQSKAARYPADQPGWHSCSITQGVLKST